MRMFNKLIYSISVITILIIGISCKKSNIIKPNGVIKDYLSSALGGCDWVIELGDKRTIYSPVNLDDKYKKDGLKVIVSYHILSTKKPCGGFVVDGGYSHLYIDDLIIADDQ